jgi:two-component sensor histidine kinase
LSQGGVAPIVTHQKPFKDVDGHTLAQAIVDTVREPLVVLDSDLRVIAASRSYYQFFRLNRQETQGRMLYELGNGQWDIPELRDLLSQIGPQHLTMEAFEVSGEFPGLGHRIMLLNARKVFYEGNNHSTLLLAIEDVTERRTMEREKDALLHEKELLLQEMQHRIYNSLQLIASILLLKARTVLSEETRQHLKDAHQRVMSVAAVQRQLEPSRLHDQVNVGSYLSRLCEGLATSMIRDGRPLFVEVRADGGTVTSTRAVSLGLITTELVLNALKHAFAGRDSGLVVVEYNSTGPDWSLSVTDDGVGRSAGVDGIEHIGLGTGIIEVLARQLDGRVDTTGNSSGTRVAITHAA